ncbi:MAG: NAD(P)-dependent oxidoreductase [Gemmatimonadales bacterium]|jgi:dihydroflavonol-4-reductase
MSLGRTLVTGATGFLGSHVAAAWVEARHDVRCTLRATSDERWLESLDVESVEWDVRDTEGLRTALRDIDTVVHVAGVTRAPRRPDYFQVNAAGSARLAEAAVKAGVSRFVLVSSLAARGPDGGDGPVSAYGQSKRRGEDLVRLFEEKMEIVILRPGGIYGPRDSDLFPLFEMADKGWLVAPAGSPPLQPVYVSDVARLTVAAGTEAYAGLGPYPVAEEGEYRWQEVRDGLASALRRRVRMVWLPKTAFIMAGVMAETAARLTRKDPPLDRRNAVDLSRHGWTCDTTPTRDAFGWEAQVRLPDGLALTAEWYRRVGWLK